MGEKTEKIYGVGLIGFAHVHARGYALAFKGGPGTKLIAVADENEERGKAGAQAVGVKEYYSDPYEMLKRDDIDIICITCETAKHAEYAVAAAEAGKHICLEKVLEVTLDRADRIIKAAKKAGVKLVCPPFPHDFNPVLRKAKEIIDKGLIGKPTMAHWHTGHRGVRAPWGEWFYDPEKAGGGALIDLGVHDIYKSLYLFGEAKEVTSMMSNVYTERVVGEKRITGIKTEDNAVTIVKFKNGVLSVSDVSFARMADLSNNAIYGTEGTILINSKLGDLAIYSTKTPPEWEGWNVIEVQVPRIREQNRREHVKAFIELIEKEEDTWRVNGKWARDVLEIVLAAYESAKSKRTISLKRFP